MSSFSLTETFPYTVAQASKLLNVDTTKIMALCNALNLRPYKDERTGQFSLRTKDFELLKKALEAEKQNESHSLVSQAGPLNYPTKGSYSSLPQRTGSMSRTDLSIIVDTVSNVKEGILKDLSQLLDDKLTGLDEVVVELIRSKSENDALKEEVKRLEESKIYLQSELSKFKPAAFGFYRKEG